MTKQVSILLTFILCLCLLSCTNTKKERLSDLEQQYITVDAKVRKYHKDGTRSYLDYQPFKTRTVELLKGYKPVKATLELSNYGGRMDKKADATGFFHVQKIKDRW